MSYPKTSFTIIQNFYRLTTVNGSAHGLGCDITFVLQQTAYVLRTCSVQCFIV